MCMPAGLPSHCHHRDMEGHSCGWRVGVEGCRLLGKAGRGDDEEMSLFKVVISWSARSLTGLQESRPQSLQVSAWPSTMG